MNQHPYRIIVIAGPTAVAGYAGTAGFQRRDDVASLTNAIASGVGGMLDAAAAAFGQKAGFKINPPGKQYGNESDRPAGCFTPGIQPYRPQAGECRKALNESV